MNKFLKMFIVAQSTKYCLKLIILRQIFIFHLCGTPIEYKYFDLQNEVYGLLF